MADPKLYGRALNKGEFILREWIGDGGFGDVYRAEQPKLGREVVVKVLRQRLRLDSSVMRRFMREAQLAARLDHPYAAHVYAFGAEPDGLLWIAMELVHGVTLDCWLTEREPLTLDELVPFLERVADVVQTAHDNGIIHRDLKPANIMVIERAGKLLPKLLDFGLAKLLDASLPRDAEIAYVDDDGDELRDEIAYVDEDEAATEAGIQEDTRLADDASPGSATTGDQATRTSPRTGPTVQPPHRNGPYRRPGRRVCYAAAASGSPPYMAPEQWSEPTVVGPSSDLYALAIVAYEALTGRRPFTAFTVDSWSEAHRFAPVPPLGEGFPPALDRFFQRALAKRPEDRWGTAVELAAALRTELDARLRTQVRVAARQWQDRGQPRGLLWRDEVLADLERWLRQAGAPQLTAIEAEFVDASRALAVASRRRATRTKRGLAAVGVAALAGMAGGYVMLQRRSIEHEVTQVKIEAGRQSLLHSELADAQRQLSDAYQRGDHSPAVEFMLARALQPRLAELARFSAVKGRMWSATFSPDGRQIVTADDASARVWDAQTKQLLITLPHGDTVYDARYSVDGQQLFTACGDGTIRVWNASTGALVRELRHEGKPLRYFIVAVSPGEDAVAAIDTMGTVAHVWNVRTGALLADLPNDGSAYPSLAFSHDGRWLSSSGGDKVHVFDVQTWKLERSLPAAHVLGLAWDPTGDRLLTGTADGDASIWGVPGGELVRHRDIGGPVDAVAFSPDGQLVAAASRDGAEQVWRAESGKLQSQANYIHAKIFSVEFDATSKLLVAAGANGTVAVADAVMGMPITVLDGPQSLVRVAHFDSSSRRVVGASLDGIARVWDATSPYRRWTTPASGGDCNDAASIAQEGRFIAIGCRSRAVRIWDTAADRLLAELPARAPDFMTALHAVSTVGDRAAIAHGNAVDLYELPSGRLLRTIDHAAAVDTVAFAPAGRDLVSGAADGSLLLTRDEHEPLALDASGEGIDVAIILPDGRVAAAAGNRVRVFSSAGAVLVDLEAPSRVRTLRASADGRHLLATARLTKAISPTLWDLESYRRIAQLEGHVGLVYSAHFVRGGSEILTAGGDGTARLWDGGTGQLHQTFHGGARFLADDAALSPDGAMVVAGGSDGVLRFWDVVSGRQLWTVEAHKSEVIGIHFENDDIITRGLDGDVSRWTLPNPEQVIGACNAREACAIVPK